MEDKTPEMPEWASKWREHSCKNKVKVRVISQKGYCLFDHKEGDEWIFGDTSPAGLCLGAFGALLPFIRILIAGGHYEFPVGSGVVQLCCTDPFNPVIFELTTIPEDEQAPS